LIGLGETARGGVGEGPTGFFLGFEICVLEDVDEGWDDVATEEDQYGVIIDDWQCGV
jgi:hypothetical protein